MEISNKILTLQIQKTNCLWHKTLKDGAQDWA